MCPTVFPALAPLFASAGTAAATAGAAAGAAGAASAGIGAMGTLSLGLSTAGGLISAYGQIQNNKATARAAKLNAAATEKASRDSIAAGEKESDKLRRQGAISTGAMRAQMAANGIDPNSADAMSLLNEQRTLIEEDAFTIRENSRRQGQGMAQQSANYTADASTARSNAFFQPMGTLLTTGAKVGEKYASWSGAGSYR